MGRNERLRHSQALCDGGRAQAAGSTEGHQRQLSRVVPTFHGHHAQGPTDAGARDVEDALGRIARANAEAASQGFEGACNGIEVELQATVEKGAGVEMAQEHVRVRQGQPVAAAVGDRAGVGTRAGGADVQHAARVHFDEGSAAAPDRVKVHRGDLDRVSADVHGLGRSSPESRGALGVVEGDVGAGPAHVQRDERAQAGFEGRGGGAHDAAGGTRDQHAHGLLRGAGCGHGAAAGLQHVQGRRREALPEPAEVVPHQGRQRRVDDRGRGPLELAMFAHDVGGARDRQAQRSQRLHRGRSPRWRRRWRRCACAAGRARARCSRRR